jgi:hypothetical protein
MKNENGYYNEKVIGKFNDGLKDAKAAVKATIESGETPRVKFSGGNTKMGAVASVSTLPFITCPSRCAGTCGKACYAAKLANLRPAVLNAYAWNTALYMLDSKAYFDQIDDYCKGVRYFRFHVSGDIVNKAYFAEMVKIALDNPKTEILAFTKRYEVVNAWISENGKLPENLHILFSGWNNLKTINPHGLPETTVYEKEEEFNESWKTCGGNCFNCACRGLGCWQAKTGDIIAFKKH